MTPNCQALYSLAAPYIPCQICRVRCSQDEDMLLCHRRTETVTIPCSQVPMSGLLCNVSYRAVECPGYGSAMHILTSWRCLHMACKDSTAAYGSWRCSDHRIIAARISSHCPKEHARERCPGSLMAITFGRLFDWFRCYMKSYRDVEKCQNPAYDLEDSIPRRSVHRSSLPRSYWSAFSRRSLCQIWIRPQKKNIKRDHWSRPHPVAAVYCNPYLAKLQCGRATEAHEAAQSTASSSYVKES